MKINYFFLAVLLILFFGCSPGSDDENPENEDLTEDISGDANSDDNDDDSSSDDSNDDDTSDDSDDDSSSDDDNSSEGTVFIAGHDVANETVLRNIPEEYINKAREEFHVAYQHTSHGTHVSRGVFGLIDYKMAMMCFSAFREMNGQTEN
jgi:cobalamin biosynthesis protein CobT